MSQDNRPMDREDAIHLAQYFAFNTREKHEYLPKNKTEAATWEPHEWVIQAIIEASRNES